MFQPGVGFGGGDLREFLGEFVNVAVDVRRRGHRFLERLRGGLESGTQRVDPFQGRLRCGAEDAGQQRGRFFCRKGTEFHEKALQFCKVVAAPPGMELREIPCRFVANWLQRRREKHETVIGQPSGAVLCYLDAPGGLGTTWMMVLNLAGVPPRLGLM